MAQQLSARQPHYKCIPLKLSSETLMGSGEFGIDPKVLDRIALEVDQLVRTGVQIGLAVGGDNLFRSVVLSATGMDRVTGDHIGMLVTAMNGPAMRDVLERSNIPALVMSTISMVGVTDHYDCCKAMRHLDGGEMVIFSAGIGNPLLTTDLTACLCAIEIDADVVLKAAKVDGVHTADLFKDPNAEKSERLTYDGMLDHRLGAMDLTVTCLCRDQNMPLRVFNMSKPDALLNIVAGGTEGVPIEEG